jgi:hypothetical protein
VKDARILADHLVAAVSGIAGKRLVDVFDLGVHVGNDDAFGALLDRQREFAQHLVGLLALGDVEHDAAQPARLAVLLDHGHRIVQPYRAAITGKQAIFELVRFHARRAFGAIAGCPADIVGMHVRQPEAGLRPFLGRVAEQAFRLFADESEYEGIGIRFPDDTVSGIHQVAEAALGCLEDGFGVLALGNVAQVGREQMAVTIFQGTNGQLDREFVSVGAHGHQFQPLADSLSLAGGHKMCQPGAVPFAVCLGHDQLAQFLSERLFRRIPEQGFGTGIPGGDPAVLIHADHRIERGLDQQLSCRERLAQRGRFRLQFQLHLLAFGDVASDREGADDMPCRIVQWTLGGQQVTPSVDRIEAFFDQAGVAPGTQFGIDSLDPPCLFRPHQGIGVVAQHLRLGLAKNTTCSRVEQQIAACFVLYRNRVIGAARHVVEQFKRVQALGLDLAFANAVAQILALTPDIGCGGDHQQRQNSGKGQPQAVTPALSKEFGAVHLGDQEPVGAQNGTGHAEHGYAAIVFALEQAGGLDFTTQDLRREQLRCGDRCLEARRRIRAIHQIVEIHHLVAIAAEQQCLSAGAGYRPGLEQGKEIGGRFGTQYHGGCRQPLVDRQRSDKIKAQAVVGVAIGGRIGNLVLPHGAAHHLQQQGIEGQFFSFRVPQYPSLDVDQQDADVVLATTVFPQLADQFLAAGLVTLRNPAQVARRQALIICQILGIATALLYPVRDLACLEFSDSLHPCRFVLVLMLQAQAD